MEKRLRAMSGKQLAKVKELNRKASAKKSNIKSRYGIEVVDVPKIDVTLKGKALKKQIEKVESFLNRNANSFKVKNPHDVVTTFKDVKRNTKLVKKVNKERKKEYEKLINMTFTAGTVSGPMKKVNPAKTLALKPNDLKYDFKRFMSQREYDRRMEKRWKEYGGDFMERKRVRYKDNYFNTILEEMGDTPTTRKMIDVLDQLSPDDFYVISLSNDQTDIKYIYDAEQIVQHAEKIMTAWTTGARNLDVDFKYDKDS